MGPGAAGPGGQVGRYKLLSILGEGGCGVVYLAEQERPVKRRVGLKLIKPGMDSKEVVARFEAERQALALLDHPNIAHVHDAGTAETGRPYFVMEYVKGVPITTHCDTRRLSIADRLGLFAQVCDGVQHAHQKGIIHRDIKPSNILVSIEGDKAIPMVIDFGIAKALSQPLTERTLVTEQGQLMGTPEYMSPEQADLTAQDIDTRSDVYSLGAVLYELLTGVLPFDPEGLRSGGIEQIRRIIGEEEPKTPSIRLTSLGEEAEALAQRRRTDVSSLARCLHRELEWIPLKAMRKDRTRRYRSASELADDIQNYLDGRPLIAGPESITYRMGKLVRKHGGTVAAAVIVLAALVIGLVTSTVMYLRAEDARKGESQARATAQQAKSVAQDERDRAESEAARASEQAEAYRRALYVNSITLANAYQASGDWRGARELLFSCPTDLRAWEWYRLWGISNEPGSAPGGHGRSETMKLHGHTGQVWAVAINHNGTRVVSGGEDKTVRIWDTEDGAEIMVLHGHTDRVKCVAFSPDSKIIASACDSRTIKLWNATTGAEIRTFTSSQGGGWRVAFAPDGKRIASSGINGAIKILDMATGREVQTLATGSSHIRSLSFLTNGDRLVFSGSASDIEVSDLGETTRAMILRGHISSVLAITCSSPDMWIASGGIDATVRIWDVKTGSIQTALSGHASWVHSVTFSPDARLLASGSADGTVRVWATSAWAHVLTLDAKAGAVRSVAFGPANRRIASGHQDGNIRIWTAATQQQVAVDINASSRDRDSQTGRLIAWWKFDEIGGNVVEDSSGNGLRGTLMGHPQRVSGRIGSALFFDGEDDYVDCGNSPMFDITGSMTIAAWVQVQTFKVSFSPIITKGDEAWRLQRYGSTDSLEFNVSSPLSRPLLALRGGSSVDDGRWHHVAGTYDGRRMCLYLDGELEVSCPLSPVYDMDINDKPVYIGANAHWDDRKWSGLIDDIRIYNYALAPDEVADLIPPR